MIAVRLMGGLGNQMFQYAIARRLAYDRKTKPILDLVFFENIAASDTSREYEIDCFNIEENILSPRQRPSEEAQYAGIKGKLQLTRHKLQKKHWYIQRENGHGFDPSVLHVKNNAYLIGYWQTEEYFKDIRNILLKDFSIKTPPRGNNKKILEKILQSKNPISIHVRRGDYVSNTNASEFHGTKDKTYYEAAITKMVQKGVKNPDLFVFSDDPEWCKKNLKFAFKTTYVEGNEKGFEDMRLMMNCKHNIIANSSFSWWAAWLNTNPEKIIVAPKVWFNDVKTNKETNVVPKTWIRL